MFAKVMWPDYLERMKKILEGVERKPVVKWAKAEEKK